MMPDDVMLFLVGMYAHAPGMQSRNPQAEWRCLSGWSHSPYMEWETVTPGAYHDTFPPVTSLCQLFKPGRIQFIKNILKI